jgi:uncharacterized protein (TIGR02611 family)
MRLRDRVVDFRQRVRATRTGRLVLQAVIGAVGVAVVVIGIILIPLPGPGWLIVLAGLAILALEFVWAQRLLDFTRARLQAWWRWLSGQPLVVRLVIGGVGLVFVAGVMLSSLWLSFDAAPSDIWRYVRR